VRSFQRLCIFLVTLHICFLTLSLLSSDLSPTTWRWGGFWVVAVVIVSTAVGIATVCYAIARRAIAPALWGLAVLFFNVLPYVLLMVRGRAIGL
jgi:hypothetical protein